MSNALGQRVYDPSVKEDYLGLLTASQFVTRQEGTLKLTAIGPEFLNVAREDFVWNSALGRLRELSGSAPLGIVKDALDAICRDHLHSING